MNRNEEYLENGYFEGKTLSSLPSWFKLDYQDRCYDLDPNQDRYFYYVDGYDGDYSVYTKKGTDVIISYCKNTR